LFVPIVMMAGNDGKLISMQANT